MRTLKFWEFLIDAVVLFNQACGRVKGKIVMALRTIFYSCVITSLEPIVSDRVGDRDIEMTLIVHQ